LRHVLTLRQHPASVSKENAIADLSKKEKIIFPIVQTAHPCAVALMKDKALKQ